MRTEAAEPERGVIVNLPDVLFEFGQARLTAEAQAKTRDMARIFNTQARGRQLSVSNSRLRRKARKTGVGAPEFLRFGKL